MKLAHLKQRKLNKLRKRNLINTNSIVIDKNNKYMFVYTKCTKTTKSKNSIYFLKQLLKT